MNINWDERSKINIKHADCPQVGDYWEEMFCGQYLIIAVTPALVAVCQDKEQVDADHWCFDLHKITVYTRQMFSNAVRYSSPAMNNKTWCDVHPTRMLADAQEAKSAAIKAIAAYKTVANSSWVTRLVNTLRVALKGRLAAWAAAL